MVAIIEQNERLMKKLKAVDKTVDVIAESIDTLIEIETVKIKKG